MNIDAFNGLENRKDLLTRCCGSSKWVDAIDQGAPYEEEELLFQKVLKTWFEDCSENDFLEAFQHHPKIGNIDSLREKFANTKGWAGNEQAGVNAASEEILEKLAAVNDAYEDKFGFIFIVCATGKSAREMLQLASTRLAHSKEEEMKIAASEQFKITLLRLQKALDLEYPRWSEVSQVTTHVLDTSLGKPGEGMCIKLKAKTGATIAVGITNKDGRIADLLPPGIELEPDEYQMHFYTGDYYELNGQKGFYPSVPINFETFDKTHYHVPLLINPFGYSTYRGS